MGFVSQWLTIVRSVRAHFKNHLIFIVPRFQSRIFSRIISDPRKPIQTKVLTKTYQNWKETSHHPESGRQTNLKRDAYQQPFWTEVTSTRKAYMFNLLLVNEIKLALATLKMRRKAK